MIRLMIVLGGLLLTGCGMAIGTTDYWNKYNQAIRAGIEDNSGNTANIARR